MDTNDNKKKLTRNNTKDDAYLEDEHPINSSPTVKNEQSQDFEDHSNTASNAGILFYQFFTKQMENEINELEEAIENTKSTIETQKQNIIEMETQKQNMIHDFHEQYRKFGQKTDYQIKLEDEIESIVPFLENLVTLNNDIKHMKNEESYIRNYVVLNLKKNYEELKEIENKYALEIEKLQEKVNNFDEMLNLWETLDKLNGEMSHSIGICEEKINRLQWSIKNETIACEQIENEGTMIQIQTKMEINEKHQILINKVLQTQQNFRHVQNEFLKLKEFKDTALKKMVEKLQAEFLEKSKKINEIENTITITMQLIEELQRNNEQEKINLENITDNVNNFIRENEILSSLLKTLKTKIDDERSKQNNLLKTKVSMEEEIKQISVETEKLKAEQKIFEAGNDLFKSIEVNDTLRKEIDDFKEQKTTTKKEIIDLQTELEEKKNSIKEMKKHLLSSYNFNNINESNNFLESYLKIETQQNVVHESVESELNDLFDEICDLMPEVNNLEEILKQCEEEGIKLDEAINSNEKILQKKIEDIRDCDNSIHTLKQSVYQGKSITQQDLNKKLNILINGIKTEQVVVEKLKKEMEHETRQKRPLFSVENKRRSNTERSMISKSKNDKSQEAEENNVSSPDSDIYTFK